MWFQKNETRHARMGRQTDLGLGASRLHCLPICENLEKTPCFKRIVKLKKQLYNMVAMTNVRTIGKQVELLPGGITMALSIPNMNHLYRDLFANSPQTITMEIPVDMGSGQISQVVTKQGTVFSDWKMNYRSDLNVHGISSEDYIQIIFCLNEGVSWNIADERQGCEISKGESCIYRGHGKTEYLCYRGNCDFNFKNVKIPVSYFEHILHSYFEDSEIAAYEKKLLKEISKVKITPYIEHIFAELKDFSLYRGGLGYLFLESKIYELLSVYLSEVLELSILDRGKIQISRTDRDAILEAKRIIDAQLAYAPGCEELARQVSLSMSKLTKGFSAMFGTSVHAYIIDQRLEKAAGMLLESDMNVSQIAALVGYSKSSNFAAAFKKKYGVLPRYYKNENTTR